MSFFVNLNPSDVLIQTAKLVKSLQSNIRSEVINFRKKPGCSHCCCNFF